MKSYEFQFESALGESASSIWKEIANMPGVNWELGPFIYMTSPEPFRNKSISDWPTGESLFRSILLFFRFLPIDIHFFGMKNIGPNAFEEKSSSLVNSIWEHHRSLFPQSEESVLIRDSVRYSARLPFMGALLFPVYKLVFAHRHKKLRRKFGEISETVPLRNRAQRLTAL